MRTSFFPFNSVALELDSLDDVVVLISVADFSTALRRHCRTRSLFDRATSDAG